jgi:hypothetical protein
MARGVAPFIDARKWLTRERRSALVRFDDVAVMFTASWERPSTLVQRADGKSRRKHLVMLRVPAEHKERPFHLVRSVTLYPTGGPPLLATTDIDGVSSRDLHSVTLAVFIE